MPGGCGVSGWSKLRARRNLFTAVYYDPAILPEELDARLKSDIDLWAAVVKKVGLEPQ